MKRTVEDAAKRLLPTGAVVRIRPYYNTATTLARRVTDRGENVMHVSVDGREVPVRYTRAAAGHFQNELDGDTVENCVPTTLLDVPERCDAIFDIGAFVGLYAALFRAINPDLPIYSYEPHKRNRQICHRTVAANDGGVAVYATAVSGNTGRTAFHESVEGDQGHSIVEHPDGGAVRDVKAATIGHELRRHNSRHPFVKLDIEGGESVVLADLLALQMPVSGMVELHPDKLDDGVAEDLVAQLESACHYCKLLGDSSPDHPMADRTGNQPNRPIYAFTKP